MSPSIPPPAPVMLFALLVTSLVLTLARSETFVEYRQPRTTQAAGSLAETAR